jgi:hypothetical protein
LFERYISGLALFDGSAGRMLQNRKYLGDDYYPVIIDRATFIKAEEDAKKGQKRWIGCMKKIHKAFVLGIDTYEIDCIIDVRNFEALYHQLKQ